MQAIEFVTKSEKGYIKIPKEYENKLKKEFRVLILLDTKITKDISKKTKSKKKLNAVRIKTKGLKINREELHER